MPLSRVQDLTSLIAEPDGAKVSMIFESQLDPWEIVRVYLLSSPVFLMIWTEWIRHIYEKIMAFVKIALSQGNWQ
jgi:hypothetical protein